MKKILAWILAAVLLLGMAGAAAEGTEETGKYEVLKVGTTTPFSGNFFSEALGNNNSDIDIRRLIHGYNLVYWDSATGSYQFNDMLVRAATVSGNGTNFVFALSRDLTYNDGTPITAADYAFTLLLLGSKELQEAAGARGNLTAILGGKDYEDGVSSVLSGLKIQGEHQFSLEIDPAFMPYFYQLKALQVAPMPISVIAPGCEIKDDGNGAYISGPFTAELLKQTLLDPDTGYVSHPAVTCGPYMLTGFDGTKAELAVNPAYIGDHNGAVPRIGKIIYSFEKPETIMESLAEDELDLVVRRARQDQIMNGMALTAGGDFGMNAYSRTGLSYISFCAEKGPTVSESVRKAISMCLDRESLTNQYTGSFGTTVDGYYGIGQWMFLMANGTLIPEEGQEEEWADLNLDGLTKYELDPEAAAALLEADGWTLNADGTPYSAAAGGVRCKQIGSEIVPLALKLIYPTENGAGPLLEETFAPYLAQAGMSLETEAVEMQELLKQYYGQTERSCDMILLGSDLGEVFDPTGEYDENGTNRLSGITDPTLRELALEMRSTEPGLATEFCRRWLRYQERLTSTAAVLPIYSDAYLDFHIVELQDYEPSATGAWTEAIVSAYLGDYVAVEEETEEEEELEEGEEIFD